MTAPTPNRRPEGEERRTDRESQQFHLHHKTALDRRDTLDNLQTMLDAQLWRLHGERLMAALEKCKAELIEPCGVADLMTDETGDALNEATAALSAARKA